MSVDETNPGDPPPGAERDGNLAFNTSVQLLRRAQAGDAEALDRLVQRYLPSLRQWAGGRLPRWARERFDTDDLIQEMLLAVLPHVEDFEPRREGALKAYMRLALLNRIRREIGRTKRRPLRVELELEDDPIPCPDPARSPLENVIDKELVERYEAALARLRAKDRDAIIARVEMGCSFEQIAQMLNKPTAHAARMAVSRALKRLAQYMEPDL